ncbi:diacylglycerol kinase family protein [Hansschlegelia quercus]|uniref:diacylglycerol kinase family protein n=1 Tax=Hansschlegelia quercus TaxID=2528245 RepID=UPI0013EEFC74|nr:diacylglycerol kinase family protein [Hansschlegelia quercus]
MSVVGIIANGRSWRNTREAVLNHAPPGVLVEAPETLDGYPAALTRFAQAGVSVVAVDGGDGTLRDVLSALPQAYGDKPPSIAIIPSGKTNVAALDVGGVARSAEGLERLAQAATSGAWRAEEIRRPIMVTTDGWTRIGFVFGLGAYERTTRLVNERVHSRGFAQGIGVALGVLMGGAAAFGKDRQIWRSGVPLSIAVDGAPARSGHSFVLLATSLHRLILRLYPFWGEGEGAIRLTEIAAPPRRLARGFLALGLGRKPSFADKEGYASLRADQVSLTLSDPFILDGDAFSPGPDGRVELKAGSAIRFVSL